jgi:hypothetical protein
MEACSAGMLEYGGKGRRVKYWARLGYWISTCYGSFSFGGRFETYEPLIYLISHFFSGCGEPHVLSQWIRGHTCNVRTAAVDGNCQSFPLNSQRVFRKLFRHKYDSQQSYCITHSVSTDNASL